MKITKLKHIGKIGRINQQAAKINRSQFEERENKRCEVPGCTNLAEHPHHRRPRHEYRHKYQDVMLKRLTDPAEIIWICRQHHQQLPPGSKASEALFIKLKGTKHPICLIEIEKECVKLIEIMDTGSYDAHSISYIEGAWEDMAEESGIELTGFETINGRFRAELNIITEYNPFPLHGDIYEEDWELIFIEKM